MLRYDDILKAFPVFRALLLLCIILNANRRTKNGGGLGTKLTGDSVTVVTALTTSMVVTVVTVVQGDNDYMTKYNHPVNLYIL